MQLELSEVLDCDCVSFEVVSLNEGLDLIPVLFGDSLGSDALDQRHVLFKGFELLTHSNRDLSGSVVFLLKQLLVQLEAAHVPLVDVRLH